MAMVSTYRASVTNVTWAASKNMFVLQNHTASGKIVQLSRMWMHNFVFGGAAVGGVGLVQLWKYTPTIGSWTGGTIIPFKYNDTSNGAPPVSITMRYGMLDTLSAWPGAEMIRQIARCTGPYLSTANTAVRWNEISQQPVLNVIWDAGYGDTNVQKLTLRAGEGVVLYSAAVGTYTSPMATDISAEILIY